MKRLFVLVLVMQFGAVFAAPTYATAERLYRAITQLQGQDALMLLAREKWDAQSTRWAQMEAEAIKVFDDDHACAKAAYWFRLGWTQQRSLLSSSPKPLAVHTLSSHAYNAGNWMAGCYDEVEKLASPSLKRKS